MKHRFSCNHWGLGAWCHRCKQADKLMEISEDILIKKEKSAYIKTVEDKYQLVTETKKVEFTQNTKDVWKQFSYELITEAKRLKTVPDKKLI